MPLLLKNEDPLNLFGSYGPLYPERDTRLEPAFTLDNQYYAWSGPDTLRVSRSDEQSGIAIASSPYGYIFQSGNLENIRAYNELGDLGFLRVNITDMSIVNMGVIGLPILATQKPSIQSQPTYADYDLEAAEPKRLASSEYLYESSQGEPFPIPPAFVNYPLTWYTYESDDGSIDNTTPHERFLDSFETEDVFNKPIQIIYTPSTVQNKQLVTNTPWNLDNVVFDIQLANKLGEEMPAYTPPLSASRIGINLGASV